jgi:putative tricarboxylic transport membrane protein
MKKGAVFNPSSVMAMLLLIFGIFYLNGARKLSFGNLAEPGPGWYPIILSLALLTMATVLLVTSMRQRMVWGSVINRIVVIGLILLCAVLVYDPLGYILTMFLMMFISLRVLGTRNWIVLILLSAILSGGTYWLFAIVFFVPLPQGILPF